MKVVKSHLGNKQEADIPTPQRDPWAESHAGAGENPSGVVRVPASARRALLTMLKAHKYSKDLIVDVWEFAVDLKTLKELHIELNDIRWIVARGWVDFAVEVAKPAEQGRTFHHEAKLTFSDDTCFVLNEAGVAVANIIGRRGWAFTEGPGDADVPSHHHPQLPTPTVRPHWDADRRQLRLGETIVKEYKLPSPNQCRILMAFEEEAWPARIDDPLPYSPHVDSKERLRYTIKSLNKHQKKTHIRFRGDGSGEGICWEVMPCLAPWPSVRNEFS